MDPADATNFAMPWKWVPIIVDGDKPQIGWRTGRLGTQPLMNRLGQELHMTHETCRGRIWPIIRITWLWPGPHIPRTLGSVGGGLG